ncbi:MAG: hypothetical protein IID44_08245 [Planctomycetes bacterium]|nr:hypothetical protein [Planctomycetota bacterium]
MGTTAIHQPHLPPRKIKWTHGDDISHAVENSGNLYTLTMEILRNAHGSEKLGLHVRADISKTLAGMGLGHVPQTLPSYQHELVRLYKRGTAVGEIIEATLTPGEANDRKLMDKFSETDSDYAGIVEQIRELVQE